MAPKNRARISILSEVLSFPTIQNKYWHRGDFSDDKARVGDLVSLSSAPASKWYLSWLRDYDYNNGWPKYLLESIEDGELCWWENVSVNYYDRETIRNRLTWQWDDHQFAFNDRWNKVGRRNDAYTVLPCLPTFNDDGSVTLDVRVRWGFSDYHKPQTFQNWKKVTMKQMDAYYKECKAEYDKNLAERTDTK